MNENEFPNDALTDALRRQAMAERPAFSPELHERLVQSVHDERIAGSAPRPLRIGQWYAAAAAVLIACGLAAYVMRSQSVLPTIRSSPIVTNVTNPLPAPAADLGGIVTAQIWPPKLTVQLPSTEAGISLISQPRQAPPQQANNRASLPDMLFAMLQEPTTGANGALKDVMPPEISLLADVIGLKN